MEGLAGSPTKRRSPRQRLVKRRLGHYACVAAPCLLLVQHDAACGAAVRRADSSWSPQVKALMYSPPMPSLRMRPTGTPVWPVTAAGVRSFIRGFALVGHHFHPVVGLASRASISATGRSCSQLDGQRLAVAATCANAYAQAIDDDRAVAAAQATPLVSTPPFHSSAICLVAQAPLDPRNQAAGQRHAKDSVGWRPSG